jgi:uncharacterized membrane protein YeaQ/YmgE (transglycosylase-associated protein family)
MFAMSWIWFLIVGGLAGWLAGLLMRGGGFGVIGDIVVGIIGGVIGGYLFGALGIAAYGLVGALVMSTIGAVVLIFLIRLIKRA